VKKNMLKKPMGGGGSAPGGFAPAAAAPEAAYSAPVEPVASSYSPEPVESSPVALPWNAPSYVRDAGSAVKKNMLKKPMGGGGSAPGGFAPAAAAPEAAYAAVEVAPATPAFDSPWTQSAPVSADAMPWNTDVWTRNDGNAVKKPMHKKQQLSF